MTPAEISQRRLQQLAERLEPSLRAAFLTLTKRMAPDELAAVIRLLEAGDLDGAVRLIWQSPKTLAAVAATRATWASGLLRLVQSTVRDVPVPRGLIIAAPVSSPETIAAVRRWEDTAFRRVAQDVQAGLRDTMATELARGINPRQVAVALKQGVGGGLTAYDTRIIASFRQALEEGRTADALRRTVRDRRYDPRLAKGDYTPAQIDTMVDAYRRKLIRLRAETFARTAAMEAANEAGEIGWRAAIAQGAMRFDEVRRYWVVAADERLCSICAPIPREHPDGVALDEPFRTSVGLLMRPTAHPNCVLGDTPITASPAIHAVSQRVYEGPVVVIETAAGHRLRCTPNHPILTSAGWVAAGLLDVGDDVVRYLGVDRRPYIGDDHEHVPPRIEQIAEAFGSTPGGASVEVPVAPENFHGDGFGSEIAVIRTNGDLRHRDDTAFGEHGDESPLPFADTMLAQLSSVGTAAHLVQRDDAPSHRIVRGGDLCPSCLGSNDASPLHAFGIATPSHRDPMTDQESREGGASDAALARELIDGRAGSVALDQVVSIGRIESSGHVFNLETEDGWYAADGIITHNCRCTVWIRRETAGIRRAPQPGTTRLILPRS